MAIQDRIKGIIDKAQAAANTAARYEGELESSLKSIEEICHTRDLELADEYLAKMEKELSAELIKIEDGITHLEKLYEDATNGQDISSEIARLKGTNNPGDRKTAKRTRSNYR